MVQNKKGSCLESETLKRGQIRALAVWGTMLALAAGPPGAAAGLPALHPTPLLVPNCHLEATIANCTANDEQEPSQPRACNRTLSEMKLHPRITKHITQAKSMKEGQQRTYLKEKVHRTFRKMFKNSNVNTI